MENGTHTDNKRTDPTRQRTDPQRRVGRLDSFFHITERGSTVITEMRAGLVSFFAMAYIVILNPLILGTTEDFTGHALGIPQVAAVTALAAGA